VVDKLIVGGFYYFKVRANNEIGWSPFSVNSPEIITNPIPIPGKARSKSSGIGWVELEWDTPIGVLIVSSYEVQKRQSTTKIEASEEWETVAAGMSGNSCMVQELKPCAGYLFRVRALTFDGWSSYGPNSDRFVTRRRH
jgi:hypothetical protein